MTTTAYPLIPNLEAVKRKKFNTSEDRLHAIVVVLDQEVLSRGVERDSDSNIPAEINRQSLFRWDVAGCIFETKEMQKLMSTRQVENAVTKSHLLCVESDPIFYKMAAMLFHSFYSDGSGGGLGLTAEENNEIIKSIFGDEFVKLDEAYHNWLVGHISKMLIAEPSWGIADPARYTANQAAHYRKVYKDAFFMPHIEEAIQNVTTATA